MDFIELAKSRYSCKKFDAMRQISKEQLDTILEAGRLASHGQELAGTARLCMPVDRGVGQD